MIKIDNCCEECGLYFWNQIPITLELDHKDGNRKNNHHTNLRCLCPNCHSLTSNWRGRNKTNHEDLKLVLEKESIIRRSLLQMNEVNPKVSYEKFLKIAYKTDFFCNFCKSLHNGTYGYGLFCSKSCHSKHANLKAIPEELSPQQKTNRRRLKKEKSRFFNVNLPFDKIKNDLLPFWVMHDQEYSCFKCERISWNGCPIALELEHLDGDRTNNSRENLVCLCPNCHSQTPTWRGKNIKNTVSDEVLLKALKEEKTIRQALLSVGLAGKGGNYKRANKLLLESKAQKCANSSIG